MTDWLCTFDDGSELTTTQTTLHDATAVAIEAASHGDTTVLSVCRVDSIAPALESGKAKLVAIGLTEEEADAIASGGMPTVPADDH